MKSLNVRWRLTVWYGAALIAVVAGFGAGVYVMMRQHLVARMDFELDEELGELALEVSLARDDGDLQQQLRRRFYRHASFDFQVSREGGPRVFQSERLQGRGLQVPAGRAAGAPASTANANCDIAGLGVMRVASRRAAGRDGAYLVQAAMPLLPALAELHAVRTTLLTAGALAIAAAMAGGYVLARRALAPVDRMTTLAEQISGARLGSRLEVVNAGDELGHLARTFNSMLDRLQQSMDELQRFTADAAHELRTPLAVLQTEAEVALRTPRSADEYRRVVEVTLEESKRLSYLVGRLLELARHDGPWQSPRRREAAALGSLLEDIVEQFRPVAQRQGVAISFGPAADPRVEGDDIRLSQLLFNLMDNAVKFTHRGGQVTVQCEQLAERAQVTVSDTGIGIPPTDLPHVCKRFYRADKSRNGQTPGAGLGLAISQAIVEAHRGEIEIHSTPGVGTTVRVSLPLG